MLDDDALEWSDSLRGLDKVKYVLVKFKGMFSVLTEPSFQGTAQYKILSTVLNSLH
jgi:hypothetical protein